MNIPPLHVSLRRFLGEVTAGTIPDYESLRLSLEVLRISFYDCNSQCKYHQIAGAALDEPCLPLSSYCLSLLCSIALAGGNQNSPITFDDDECYMFVLPTRDQYAGVVDERAPSIARNLLYIECLMASGGQQAEQTIGELISMFPFTMSCVLTTLLTRFSDSVPYSCDAIYRQAIDAYSTLFNVQSLEAILVAAQMNSKKLGSFADDNGEKAVSLVWRELIRGAMFSHYKKNPNSLTDLVMIAGELGILGHLTLFPPKEMTPIEYTFYRYRDRACTLFEIEIAAVAQSIHNADDSGGLSFSMAGWANYAYEVLGSDRYIRLVRAFLGLDALSIDQNGHVDVQTLAVFVDVLAQERGIRVEEMWEQPDLMRLIHKMFQHCTIIDRGNPSLVDTLLSPFADSNISVIQLLELGREAESRVKLLRTTREYGMDNKFASKVTEMIAANTDDFQTIVGDEQQAIFKLNLRIMANQHPDQFNSLVGGLPEFIHSVEQSYPQPQTEAVLTQFVKLLLELELVPSVSLWILRKMNITIPTTEPGSALRYITSPPEADEHFSGDFTLLAPRDESWDRIVDVKPIVSAVTATHSPESADVLSRAVYLSNALNCSSELVQASVVSDVKKFLNMVSKENLQDEISLFLRSDGCLFRLPYLFSELFQSIFSRSEVDIPFKRDIIGSIIRFCTTKCSPIAAKLTKRLQGALLQAAVRYLTRLIPPRPWTDEQRLRSSHNIQMVLQFFAGAHDQLLDLVVAMQDFPTVCISLMGLPHCHPLVEAYCVAFSVDQFFRDRALRSRHGLALFIMGLACKELAQRRSQRLSVLTMEECNLLQTRLQMVPEGQRMLISYPQKDKVFGSLHCYSEGRAVRARFNALPAPLPLLFDGERIGDVRTLRYTLDNEHKAAGITSMAVYNQDLVVSSLRLMYSPGDSERFVSELTPLIHTMSRLVSGSSMGPNLLNLIYQFARSYVTNSLFARSIVVDVDPARQQQFLDTITSNYAQSAFISLWTRALSVRLPLWEPSLITPGAMPTATLPLHFSHELVRQRLSSSVLRSVAATEMRYTIIPRCSELKVDPLALYKSLLPSGLGDKSQEKNLIQLIREWMRVFCSGFGSLLMFQAPYVWSMKTLGFGSAAVGPTAELWTPLLHYATEYCAVSLYNRRVDMSSIAPRALMELFTALQRTAPSAESAVIVNAGLIKALQESLCASLAVAQKNETELDAYRYDAANQAFYFYFEALSQLYDRDRALAAYGDQVLEIQGRSRPVSCQQHIVSAFLTLMRTWCARISVSPLRLHTLARIIHSDKLTSLASSSDCMMPLADLWTAMIGSLAREDPVCIGFRQSFADHVRATLKQHRELALMCAVRLVSGLALTAGRSPFHLELLQICFGAVNCRNVSFFFTVNNEQQLILGPEWRFISGIEPAMGDELAGGRKLTPQIASTLAISPLRLVSIVSSSTAVDTASIVEGLAQMLDEMKLTQLIISLIHLTLLFPSMEAIYASILLKHMARVLCRDVRSLVHAVATGLGVDATRIGYAVSLIGGLLTPSVQKSGENSLLSPVRHY